MKTEERHSTGASKRILEAIPRLSALVVGDIIVDHYVWGSTRRISPEAPVPVVEVLRDTYTAGGAANSAMNMRTLGASVEVCGWIGDDAPGRRLVEILRTAGVAFRGDLFAVQVPSIEKTRVLVHHHQICRMDRELPPADFARLGRKWVDDIAGRASEFDVVVFSDYAKGFLDSDSVNRIMQAAHAAGRLVALDPKPERPLACRGVDLLTPNRAESLLLAGISLGRHDAFPAEKVCAAIWDKYRPKHLVVTMGEEGMLLSEEGAITRRIPTVAREVFDVSGAGDTTIAALSLALATGASLVEAADFANTAAGVVIGKLGAATATPAEILAYHSRT